VLIISKKVDKYRFTGKSEFSIKKFDTDDRGDFNTREDAVNEFVENLKAINKLQQKLYAERKEGVVFIFQAMDAAGKDGVIRTVFSTLTPHGVKEYCFRIPEKKGNARTRSVAMGTNIDEISCKDFEAMVTADKAAKAAK